MITTDFSHVPSTHQAEANSALISQIRNSIIGAQQTIDTPFGKRKLTYADYTASGRSLAFIEEFIQQQVLPYYANTHTEANATGQQTTAFREEARQQIRRSVKANDEDLVIFCGSGATSAINTLISQLGLRTLDEADKKQCVIFIGPYEHHSNELPWRELGFQVIRIPEAEQGGVCLRTLEAQLKRHQGKRMIGSFSAASNVTGILCDQTAITSLLHAYQALAFWDFAAAAPYVAMDMNPSDHPQAHKDAIFFSPHKLIGGPGTPGILVVKKAIITNQKPSHIGGGTVSFVTPQDHTFLPIGERREEGGTPAIIESIRAGLVFQLKEAVGDHIIEAKEQQLVNMIHQHWALNPNIERLGHHDAERLSITAFRIKTPLGYLHHGFVTALLNDLFGIQVRGGCSCAGPYGHALLKIDEQKSEHIQQALQAGEKLLKPGWVRFNLNYFISQAEALFILQAIDFITEHGLTLLPFYAYDNTKDLWRFQNQSQHTLSLNGLFQAPSGQGKTLTNTEHTEFQRYLKEAEQLVATCQNTQNPQYSWQQQEFNDDFAVLRDFVLVQDLV